ncbi:MAG: hypothetical protein FD165_1559 [Gammaproteobacteria bacterium]|nr:MAG: hypothetical protein FD165_1559 [Gammaproteobacteria bacterium]TND05471.1 MAG: hypothetical protein FD120_1079 [Gammaproteobacteria bacterium]
MAQPRGKRMAGKRSSRKRLATLGTFWGGLALGLVMATGVYVYSYIKSSSPGAKVEVAGPAPVVPARPPVSTGKMPPGPEPARPQFDFYTILPELEVVVPEPRAAGTPDRAVPGTPPRQAAKVDAPGIYVLQIGSYKNSKDADRMKAELALIGVEANIETVSVNQTKWHRVRVGPYSQLARLNNARSELLANNIEFMLLKVKD